MKHPAISLLTNTLESYYLQHGAMPAYVALHPDNLLAIAEVMGQTVELKNNERVLQVNASTLLIASGRCTKNQLSATQIYPVALPKLI